MATYFEAINDNNKTQLDDVVGRLHLTRTAMLPNCSNIVEDIEGNSSLSNSNDTNMAYGMCYDIALNDNEKLMSIRIIDNFPSSQICFKVLRWTNNSYRLWLYSMRSVGIKSQALHTTYAPKIKCYFWGDGQTSNNNFGLQIFDAQGNQIFHSGDYVMDIIGAYKSDVTVNNDHRNYPSFNTNISIEKSLLVESLVQGATYFRGNTAQIMTFGGWGNNGIYAQDGVYKLNSFFTYFWYSERQSVVSPNSQCLRNQFYIVDVND